MMARKKVREKKIWMWKGNPEGQKAGDKKKQANCEAGFTGRKSSETMKWSQRKGGPLGFKDRRGNCHWQKKRVQ